MRLEGVGRRYGPTGPWVLDGVDLELGEGSLVRVQGGNGGGKSTLLRLLAGIDVPSAGRITGAAPRRAYVPERFPAALPLTARGYLTHIGRVHGLDKRAAARAGSEWLERLGAGQYARRRMSELSKGSSQKVALAQALLARPGLLLLDEAWTGLDGAAREVLDRAVTERVADGGTVVFVDHDPHRLAHAPGPVHRLDGGRLTTVDPRSTAPHTPRDGAPHTPRDGATVRIEAQGPPGAPPPDGLPPGTRYERLPEGALALTTAAEDSDASLRALLTARPPWHIRAVRQEGAE